MEAKQVVTLTIQKGDHSFSFHMPMGSSWGMAIDAAFDILNEVNRLATKSVESAKPASVESPQPIQEA